MQLRVRGILFDNDGVLVAYLMLSVEVYLATHCAGVFRMSYWRVGPTELRILLAIGTIMDAGPAILILGPLLAPVMVSVGVDPIHFAVVMSTTLILGLITPPMGLVLFVCSGISGERVERIAWDLLPYFAFEVAVVFAMVYFPGITLWIPRMLGYVQ